MKHTYAFLSFVIWSALSSCNKDQDIAPKAPSLAPSISTSYQLIGGQGYVVFLKTEGDTADPIFVLRTDSLYAFNNDLSVREISESNEGIHALLEDGSTLQLSLDMSSKARFKGFALSTVSGEYYYTRFYSNGRPNSNPDVGIVKCQCFENTVSRSCDAGGKGATDCSIEHSGSIAGTGVNFKCNVKCGSGYFACCRNY